MCLAQSPSHLKDLDRIALGARPHLLLLAPTLVLRIGGGVALEAVGVNLEDGGARLAHVVRHSTASAHRVLKVGAIDLGGRGRIAGGEQEGKEGGSRRGVGEGRVGGEERKGGGEEWVQVQARLDSWDAIVLPLQEDVGVHRNVGSEPAEDKRLR